MAESKRSFALKILPEGSKSLGALGVTGAHCECPFGLHSQLASLVLRRETGHQKVIRLPAKMLCLKTNFTDLPILEHYGKPTEQKQG